VPLAKKWNQLKKSDTIKYVLKIQCPFMRRGNLSENIIKVIEKATEILDCFYDKEELGITEISNLIGYNKSTVHDTIYTLTQLGLGHKNEETRRYSLRIKLFEYGSRYSQRNSLRKDVKSIGRTLSDKYQATCHLATFDKRVSMTINGLGY